MIFFSVTPLPCGNQCTCNYNQHNGINVFTCSGEYHTQLPPQVPVFTSWIIIQNTNITQLCGIYPYLNKPTNMSYLSITFGPLWNFCDDTLEQILHKSSIKWLNIMNNNISKVPFALSSASDHLDRLWMKGNPLVCNCGMIWLIDWLSGHGKYIVRDYQDVTCEKGKEIGKPVYLLKPVEEMGCTQGNDKLIFLAIFGAITVLSVAMLVPLIRYLDMRWFVYQNFGTFLGDPDANENIDVLQYDAFLSFR